VAVINNDEKIDIKESAFKASSAGIYEKLISVSNREISKAILNQTLSTEVQGGGSYAATKGHLEVREDVVDNDSAMVAEAFNTLCGWITTLNVPNAAAPVFSFEEKEDLQNERAERDEKLGKQITFTPKYYMRTYNLEEDDFELRSGQPVDAGAAEFAENSGAPDATAVIADRLDKDAAEIVDGYVDKIRALVNSASSFAEIRDGLVDLAPELNSSELGTLMQKALVAADLTGRSEVLDEIK
jgi:phage gp29-like protein